MDRKEATGYAIAGATLFVIMGIAVAQGNWSWALGSIIVFGVVLYRAYKKARRRAAVSTQTRPEEPDRAEPQSSTGDAQEGSERRSWWQRMFG
jgi:Co/Zn/Cd efflux system component